MNVTITLTSGYEMVSPADFKESFRDRVVATVKSTDDDDIERIVAYVVRKEVASA